LAIAVRNRKSSRRFTNLSARIAGNDEYIILYSDNSLYTGITTDLERRFRQHAHLCGARYFRGRKPTRVVYQERGDTRSSASSRELEFKKMTGAANTG